MLSEVAAGLQQCQICGCTCCSSSQLRFLVSTRLDFSSRSVHIAAGQFACAVCRAVSNPALLLQLSTPVPQSEDFTRVERLRELFLHFAAVNSAPAHITSNPEALALWVQQLACRAYSMCVLASSLNGWKLVGPDGQAVQAGAAQDAEHLLQQLLNKSDGAAATADATSKTKAAQKHQQNKRAEDAHAQPGKRKSVGGVDKNSSKKMKKQQAGVAAEQAQQQIKTPTQQTKAPEQRQAVRTPQQARKTPQQQHALGKSKAAKQPVKAPEQQAAAAMLTPKQRHCRHTNSSAAQQLKPRDMYSVDAAVEPATGKKKKLATGEISSNQATPSRTPQVAKNTKVVKAGKRKLSDPR